MTYKKRIAKILPEMMNTDLLETQPGVKVTYDELVERRASMGSTTTRLNWYELMLERHYEGLDTTWAYKALEELLEETA